MEQATSTSSDPSSASWLRDHAQQTVATVGMGESVLINFVVLAAGLLIWFLQDVSSKKRAKLNLGTEPLLNSSRNNLDLGPEFHTTALNYIIFLRICAEMCATLTAVMAILVIPHWGLQPFLLGLFGGPISLARDITPTGISLLCLHTTLSGLVCLVFVQRMLRHMRVRSSIRHQKWLDRTLWFTYLPVADKLTRKPFLLSDAELLSVEQFLKRAIEDDVWSKLPEASRRPAAVERVHVSFTVEDFYAIKGRLSATVRRLETVTASLQVAKESAETHSWLQPLRVWQLSTQKGCLERQKERQNLILQDVEAEKKEMSGSAFITFKESKFKGLIQKERPSCWELGSCTYFRFGVPPFSSVTLRCEQAPHPTDVLWENLHVSGRKRTLRFWSGTLLLLVFMVGLVTPVTVSTRLSFIILELRERYRDSRRKIWSESGISLPHTLAAWQWMSIQLPTMVILLINSILLPSFIGVICDCVRSHKRSKVQINQLHLNFIFLVLNQLFIPLLGLTGLEGFLEFLQVAMKDPSGSTSLLQLLDGSVFSSPGLFSLRYLLNCAFLTNTNSLLNLAQRNMRWLCNETEPWIFAWGYWYAASLAILTTAVFLGVLVPSLLPCGALFFALKYVIDRHNLKTRAYLCGAESQGSFIPRVLHIMRLIVAGTWFVIGASVRLTVRHYYANRWNSRVPIKAVEWGAVVMMLASLALCGFSFWEKVNNLHSAKYRLLRFGSRTKRSAVDSLLDAVFGGLDVFDDEEDDLPCPSRYRMQSIQSDDQTDKDADETSCPLRWDAREGAGVEREEFERKNSWGTDSPPSPGTPSERADSLDAQG